MHQMNNRMQFVVVLLLPCSRSCSSSCSSRSCNTSCSSRSSSSRCSKRRCNSRETASPHPHTPRTFDICLQDLNPRPTSKRYIFFCVLLQTAAMLHLNQSLSLYFVQLPPLLVNEVLTKQMMQTSAVSQMLSEHISSIQPSSQDYHRSFFLVSCRGSAIYCRAAAVNDSAEGASSLLSFSRTASSPRNLEKVNDVRRAERCSLSQQTSLTQTSIQ